MQALITAAAAATARDYPAWLKYAARATFLMAFLTGAAWVAMSWLALRGFSAI